MDEQTYERIVDALERKYERTIASIASAACDASSVERDYEQAHQDVTDRVFDALIGDSDWEAVEAKDISDIAWEAASVACREAREARW